MDRKFTASTAPTKPASPNRAEQAIDADSLRVLGETPAETSELESQRQQWLAQKPAERGGPKGPEPTRFGDWERAGRCFDF